MEDFQKKIRDKLLEIRLYLADSNYQACAANFTELTHIYVLLEDKTHLFITEYFEWLFTNLDSMNENTVPDKEKMKIINSKIENLLDYLIREIPIDTNEQIINMINLMIESRYEVSKMQLYTVNNRKLWKKSSRREMGINLE
jgi:hypothetical protein